MLLQKIGVGIVAKAQIDTLSANADCDEKSVGYEEKQVVLGKPRCRRMLRESDYCRQKLTDRVCKWMGHEPLPEVFHVDAVAKFNLKRD